MLIYLSVSVGLSVMFSGFFEDQNHAYRLKISSGKGKAAYTRVTFLLLLLVQPAVHGFPRVDPSGSSITSDLFICQGPNHRALLETKAYITST